MKISMQSYEIAKPFQDKWCQLLEGPGRKLYSSMIGQLLDTGRKDGMISSGIKDAQAAQVLISQAMGYLVYLQNKTWAEGVTQKEMKDFVCKSLLKCLK